MTGTLQLPLPLPWLGPGCLVGYVSDFIGPLGVDARIEFAISTDPEGTGTFIHVSVPVSGPSGSARLLVDGETELPRVFPQPTEGAEVTITGALFDGFSTAPVDTDTRQAPWQSSTGAYQVTATGQGGFTAADRQMVTDTERRTQVLGEPTDLILQGASGPIETTLGKIFSRQVLDTLTLNELTAGPTGDPLRVHITEYYFGIIVRVTQIAEDLEPRTPDQDWYFPDLAVLRVFRGSDLLYRRGIHTPTFMTEHPWEWGSQFLNVLDVFGVPPGTTIAVDWRVGCEGQVFLQRFP